jgi:hypothetical protein
MMIISLKNNLGRIRDMGMEMTGVHLAAFFGLSQAIKALLDNGCDPNVKDIRGRTPLSWAAGNGHEGATKLLLSTEGVNPDSRDHLDWTPITWATENGHEGVMALLLEKIGIDLEPKDNSNRTPMSRTRSRAVVKLLLKEYRDNGIAFRIRDMSRRQSSVICDTCEAGILDFVPHYHCTICADGDFDICQSCITDGKFCQDYCHKLIERIGKDDTYITINEMEGESKDESDAEHPKLA